MLAESAATDLTVLSGDLMGLVVPTCLGLYFTLCRRFDMDGAAAGSERSTPPAVAAAGALNVMAAAAVVRAKGLPMSAALPVDAQAALAQAAMGTVVVPLAHLLLTVAAQTVPSAEVTLAMLCETVASPCIVYAAVGEVPSTRTVACGRIAPRGGPRGRGCEGAQRVPHPVGSLRDSLCRRAAV